MPDVDLHLDPNEASDLCPVFDERVLAAQGWDRAFVTVLDEAQVGSAIAVIGHERGAGEDAGWSALRADGKPTSKAKTEDAEACARRDGAIYVLGSQFGSKGGPLQARRSWMARVSEKQLARALDGKKPKIELAPLRFGLHRAVNDALAAARAELLPLGPAARSAYIDETIQLGARKDKRWSGRVRSGDHPINVEGAEFRPDGRLLLGLRYPVTVEGHPILVELDDVAAVFEDPDAVPRCSSVWVLQAGRREEPVGIRALRSSGTDAFHAIVGNLDSTGKGASLLVDHPEGATARSAHVAFELPALAAGGEVPVRPVREFGDLRRIEGLAFDRGGQAHYVIDREGHVDLRTVADD